MQRIIYSTLLIFTLLVASSWAQPMKHEKGKMGPGCEGMQQGCGEGPNHGQMMNCKADIPDLTDEQKAQLDKMQVEHMKIMQPMHNKMNEKQAVLHTLETADQADMPKINSLIEEMGKLRIEMMKERVKHHQDVRKILNEKQRLYFDKSMHRCGQGN
jgi:Spy/CpxP family protein refolding chaperone